MAQCVVSEEPIKQLNQPGVLYIPFTMDKLPKNSRVVIGIGELSKINLQGNTFYLKENCYGIHSDAFTYSFNKTSEYGVQLQNGSKLTLKLDFVKDEMSFIVDGLNRGIAFSKLNLKEGKYHLCMQCVL